MGEVLRVLITDEDPDSRVAARKALQRAGLAIAGETGLGTQAVSFAVQSIPDAVLVAVEEPTARALETAEALSNAIPDTPILIYSSRGDAESVRRAMVFGARDYLVKPLQAAALKEAVYKALVQEERRQMRRAGQLSHEQGRGTVIVVTGAKGGIGKTVTSVNLAVALRTQTGKSVALIDADTHFGDVATLLDLAPVVTIADVRRNLARFDRAGVEGFMTIHSTGVHVLAGAPDGDGWEECDRVGWDQIVDAVSQIYEFVVVDTSGAFDSFVRGCIESASLTLVMTTAEVSSVRDTAGALRRLDGWGIERERIRVVFNRGARAGGIGRAELEQAIGQPIFWELPADRSVPRSVQLGQPVALPRRASVMGQSVQSLARLIAGTKRSLVSEPVRPSAIRRLISFGGRRNDAAVVAAPEPRPQR